MRSSVLKPVHHVIPSVPVQTGGVPAGEVAGRIGGRAGVCRAARRRRRYGFGVVGPGRVARGADVGGRISEVLVAPVQRLPLGVVGRAVALEEAALEEI